MRQLLSVELTTEVRSYITHSLWLIIVEAPVIADEAMPRSRSPTVTDHICLAPETATKRLLKEGIKESKNRVGVLQYHSQKCEDDRQIQHV